MKNFNLLIFRPTFEPLSQKKWPLSVKKNLLALSWFVITRSTVLKIFFSDNTSAISHLYRCIMAEFWITEYSGFMKNFLSLTMKNIHPFDVSSIEKDLFLFKLAICKFLLLKFPRTQKGLLETYFLIFWSQFTWKFQSTLISLIFSWTQVKLAFNKIETIILLCSKIWDFVILEIKQKKYVNVFRNAMSCKYYSVCK